MFSHRFTISILFFFSPLLLAEETVTISVGSEAIPIFVQKKIPKDILKSENGITILNIPKSKIDQISLIMHERFNRCGGFIIHSNLNEARESLVPQHVKSTLSYTINKEMEVNSLISKLDQNHIHKVIQKVSSFKNRYYQSEQGLSAQSFLKDYWEKILANRKDWRVEFFPHPYSQPSLILTIQGSQNPEEIILLGGHGDSISYQNEKAPGADDNASGIAILTEIIRVLGQENYIPKKTIKFISYAAEEVGLQGSHEISHRMKSIRANVIGVLQFDMVNFPGMDGKIYLISDYTDMDQNAFLGNLIDKYLQIPWGMNKCGYACSDHASWYNSGYRVSFPMEASMKEHNPYIHTPEDTLEKSNNSVEHALKFAKLGLSYLVEMDK